MKEVLDHNRDRVAGSDILQRLGLEASKYFIVSLHREENVDSKERLGQLVAALNELAIRYDYPVILSTHPRTRSRLSSLDGVTLNERIRDLKPFGFHDYNHLQTNCFCAISDSGTIAEEASILDFPAITPRDAIERPEAIDSGNIVLTGLVRDTITQAVELVTRIHAERRTRSEHCSIPDDYAIDNTSERVLKLIVGTAKLSNGWDGIRTHDHLGAKT
jgi:UDP-N-acetylglucosamine 2-epimerase (non-hydrolysing)